jgi:hypothetical protein
MKSPAHCAVKALQWEDLWPAPPDPQAPRVLVIPDLHQHVDNGQHWLDTQEYDRAVLLGDYFDDFDDCVEDASRMARWVKERLRDPRIICLLGNHDVEYRFPRNEALLCPGYSRAKAAAIRKILTESDWRKMKLVHVEAPWILSHAGFHPAFMEEPTPEKLVERCEVALARAAKGVVDPIFSFAQGGVPRFSGPAWLAWENFVPIPGISQIVGHTPGNEVRIKAGEKSLNLCIDVGYGEVAALIQGDQVSILRTRESTPALESPG